LSSDWLAAYLPELGNARAAIDWTFSAQGDLETGVALTVATVPLLIQQSLMDECVKQVGRALDRLDQYPGDDRRWRMRLSAVLGWPQLRSEPGREAGAAAWLRTLALAEEIDDFDYQFRSLLGLWVHAMNGGRPRDALAYADRFLSVAVRAGDKSEASNAERLRARCFNLIGDHAEARVSIERMLSTYVAPRERSETVRYYFDQRVAARVTRQRVLWIRGFPDQALRDVAENVKSAQGLGHRLTLTYALCDGACPLALLSGDLDAADHYTEMLHELTANRAMGVWRTYADAYRGEILWRRGNKEQGLRLMEVAAVTLQDTNFVTYLSAFSTSLAIALSEAGRTNDALAWIDGSLSRCAASGEGWCLPELHRVRGEILFGIGESVEARISIIQGLDIAREHGALSWELRAAISLTQPRANRQCSDEALSRLDAVLKRFSEGFETADLTAARSLLNSGA
jgi:predicted ATPase